MDNIEDALERVRLIFSKAVGLEFSKTLKMMEDALLKLETEQPDIPLTITDDGFRAAIRIFTFVLVNKMHELQKEENMPLEDRLKMATHASGVIRKLIKEMTNIDTKNLYK